jgi:hypothetical protein
LGIVWAIAMKGLLFISNENIAVSRLGYISSKRRPPCTVQFLAYEIKDKWL